ncbi:MAG: SUF system NifU family Fe-S cluster assembly protein [Gammaproteobacteria bacterium]|jgi:nitrogen fixation protein NifU and related proteins
MTTSSLYKQVLLDHYRHPHNCGELGGADVVRRGSNPRCGDDVEVGVYYDGDTVREVRFRGRGCSVCIASASLMTDTVRGKQRDEVQRLAREMHQWFSSGEGEQVPEPPESLQALSAVRQYPARRRCVLLAWDALDDALET